MRIFLPLRLVFMQQCSSNLNLRSMTEPFFRNIDVYRSCRLKHRRKSANLPFKQSWHVMMNFCHLKQITQHHDQQKKNVIVTVPIPSIFLLQLLSNALLNFQILKTLHLLILCYFRYFKLQNCKTGKGHLAHPSSVFC